MKTMAFAGGSIVAGYGFPERKESKDIYPSLFKSEDCDIANLGIGGATNYEIFMAALNFLAVNKVDIMVVEWNGFFRFRFHPRPGINLYVSTQQIFPPDEFDRFFPFTQKDLDLFQKMMIMFNGEYNSVETLLDYCLILQSVCRSKKIELVMLNGSAPWTQDIAQDHPHNTDLDQSLSDFTKNMLDFDQRDDSEVMELLSSLRDKFKSIDLGLWAADPFDRLVDMKIDRSPLDQHPGVLTHRHIASMIIQHLNKRGIA